MGQVSKTKSAQGEVVFECKTKATASIERAIAFTMTVDTMHDLGKNLIYFRSCVPHCSHSYIKICSRFIKSLYSITSCQGHTACVAGQRNYICYSTLT